MTLYQIVNAMALGAARRGCGFAFYWVGPCALPPGDEWDVICPVVFL